jgi:hypothetical protein
MLPVGGGPGRAGCCAVGALRERKRGGNMGYYIRLYIRLHWIVVLLFFEGMLLVFSSEYHNLKTWALVIGILVVAVAIQYRLIYVIMRERREKKTLPR